MRLADYLDGFIELAEAHGADHVHFFLEDRTESYASWSEQRDQQQVQEMLGLSVQVYGAGQQGFAATHQLSSEGILTTLQRAMSKAGLTPPSDAGALANETLPPLEVSAFKSSGRVTSALGSSCNCQVYVWEQRQRVYSYDRQRGLLIDSRHRGSVVCELPPDERFFIERSYGWAGVSPEIEAIAIDLSQVVHWAHLELKQAVSLEEGRYAAVLQAGAAGMLFHELAHLLEARDGEALWEPELTTTKRLTLVDDPTIPGRLGSQLYDDEGVRSQRVSLIEQGQITAHLTHRLTKMQADAHSNGHGRRQDFRYRPMSRMTNLVVAPGDRSLEQLVSDVKEGLFIRKISGGEANHRTGMIELKVEEAFLIAEGEITTALEPFVISQLATELLEGIQGVGLDVETISVFCKGTSGNVPVSLTQPSIAIDGIQVIRRK